MISFLLIALTLNTGSPRQVGDSVVECYRKDRGSILETMSLRANGRFTVQYQPYGVELTGNWHKSGDTLILQYEPNNTIPQDTMRKLWPHPRYLYLAKNYYLRPMYLKRKKWERIKITYVFARAACPPAQVSASGTE